MKTTLILGLSAWSALALAQTPDDSRPPTEETEIAQTRDGYKARNARHRAHEEMYNRSYAHPSAKFKMPPIPPNEPRYVFPLVAIGNGTLEERVGTVTCDASAVVIATVYNARPVLSQQETYVWTEYKVEVNEVMKGTLRVGDRITIPRIGGTIDLPGDRITFDSSAHPPLQVGGTYLLFLSHLPQTGDYEIIISPNGLYEMGYGATIAGLSLAHASSTLSIAREACGR